MKKLIFLIIFSQSFIFYAQKIDTTRVLLSKTEFEKLKLDFVKVRKTKLFQKSEKIKENYLRNVFICSNTHNELAFKKCLQEKLGEKEKKKIIKLREKSYELKKRLERKFPEVYDLLKKTTIKQRVELRKRY